MAFDLAKLNELDFNNLGSQPWAVKGVLLLVISAIVLALGYFLHISKLSDELDGTRAREESLWSEFKEKQGKAAALDIYKQQMKEMEESFGTMLRQLPSKTEVADLLVDVTQTGLAAGLTFDTFKPEKEVPLEFYAELPITVKVIGSYHSFGNFVSGVAGLPRIVTLHDLAIKPADAKSGSTLALTAVAKTYRYLDAQELAEAAAKKAAEAKAKGKAKGKK